MTNFIKSKNKLNIEINTHDLSPEQVRLICSLNTMLAHLLQTDREDEFFDGSAEFMRICACVIKQSYFTEKLIENNNIPYVDQALEFAMDILTEQIAANRIIHYDN